MKSMKAKTTCYVTRSTFYFTFNNQIFEFLQWLQGFQLMNSDFQNYSLDFPRLLDSKKEWRFRAILYFCQPYLIDLFETNGGVIVFDLVSCKSVQEDIKKFWEVKELKELPISNFSVWDSKNSLSKHGNGLVR